MNLFLNSPAYYTQTHGVVSEIYEMCQKISANIDISKYTKVIDTIGITPIIVPNSVAEKGVWDEEKRISLRYRMASISLRLNYDSFLVADVSEKKHMILDNIFCSLSIIKRQLQNNFDYAQMENDIRVILKNTGDGSLC